MHFLFVRHGKCTANTSAIFANRDVDAFPLTPLGRRQSQELAKRLAAEPIHHIYTSPLRRARETAAIVARPCTLPVHIASALREYDVGDFEAQQYGGSQSWRMRHYDDNEARWRRGDVDHRLAGGESLRELQERLIALIRDLERRHGSSDTILLVGHGGLFRAALPGLLANVTHDFAHQHPMDHCTVVRACTTDGQLKCAQWGRRCLT